MNEAKILVCGDCNKIILFGEDFFERPKGYSKDRFVPKHTDCSLAKGPTFKELCDKYNPQPAYPAELTERQICVSCRKALSTDTYVIPVYKLRGATTPYPYPETLHRHMYCAQATGPVYDHNGKAATLT